jgi:hypothetical protein
VSPRSLCGRFALEVEPKALVAAQHHGRFRDDALVPR